MEVAVIKSRVQGGNAYNLCTLAPLKGRFKGLATNSAKAVFYGRGKNGFKTIFCDLEECVKLAVE